MQIRELRIPNCFEVTPAQHADDRGVFLEWYRFDRLAEAVGHPLQLAQANTSVSRKGTVRGIHFADIPPSQAKYVTAVHGTVMDFVIDIRVGSPTFGQHEAVELDSASREALYLSEGLGHGFCALSDSATVGYLCSEPYAPTREFGIHPLDPTLALPWPDGADSVLSPKDAAAPTFAEAQEQGLLPSYDECIAFRRALG